MPDKPENLEYEYRKQRYETYVKERDALRSDSLEVSGRYDKAVLTIAGGALALSVAFLEKIAPHPISWTPWLLGTSWLSLITSTLLELFALSTSQTVTNELMECVKEEYRQYLLSLPDHPPVPAPARTPESQAVVETWKNRTRLLNRCSLWLLTVGVFLLCAFSLLNPPSHTIEGETMASPVKTPPPKPLNESKGSYLAPSLVLPPPPPPKPPSPSKAQ